MEKMLLCQGKGNAVLKILNDKLTKAKKDDPVNYLIIIRKEQIQKPELKLIYMEQIVRYLERQYLLLRISNVI